MYNNKKKKIKKYYSHKEDYHLKEDYQELSENEVKEIVDHLYNEIAKKLEQKI